MALDVTTAPSPHSLSRIHLFPFVVCLRMELDALLVPRLILKNCIYDRPRANFVLYRTWRSDDGTAGEGEATCEGQTERVVADVVVHVQVRVHNIGSSKYEIRDEAKTKGGTKAEGRRQKQDRIEMIEVQYSTGRDGLSRKRPWKREGEGEDAEL